MIAKDMNEEEFVQVPVRMDGNIVGWAHVDKSGKILMGAFDTDTHTGEVLYRRITSGLVQGFTLAVDNVKAVPAWSGEQTKMLPKVSTQKSPKFFSWNDFRAKGLLWLINRVVFHPRGRALALVLDDHGNAMGWQLYGTGKEVWAYDHEEEKSLFLAAEETLRVEMGEEKEGI